MDIDRCRLVLIANPDSGDHVTLSAIAETNAIACCILYGGNTGEKDFLAFSTETVRMFQDHNIPVLIADDSQVMGRSGADGLYLEKAQASLQCVMDDLTPDRMVGCGNFKTRHDVMEAGETGVDFILMGKLGGDTKTEPHPRNIQMASWCAEVLEVSVVVQAGNSIESLIQCAQTGADFVAVEQAVFNSSIKPKDAVIRAEEILEQHAPRFEEAEA